MKKIISLILSIAMLASIIPVMANDMKTNDNTSVIISEDYIFKM